MMLRCQSAVLALTMAASLAAGALAQPTRSSGEDLSRTNRFWLSGGFGPAGFHGTSGISARASATATVDRAVGMFRMTGSIEGIDGHVDHREKSALVGVRFGGKNLYLIPAMGIGYAHWHDDLCTAHITCTPAVAAQYEDEGRVVAFDVGLHASKLFAGFGVNLTGVKGSGKTDLMALVFSLELGAFGR